MKNMTNMTNQGGRHTGDNPKPDGLPNEILATDADYRYEGGRQSVGEVPNPREVREATENYRGTTNQDARDDNEPVHGEGQNRTKHVNGQARNRE